MRSDCRGWILIAGDDEDGTRDRRETVADGSDHVEEVEEVPVRERVVVAAHRVGDVAVDLVGVTAEPVGRCPRGLELGVVVTEQIADGLVASARVDHASEPFAEGRGILHVDGDPAEHAAREAIGVMGEVGESDQ